MAGRVLAMSHPELARRAADLWLRFREPANRERA
jgi:hypothetical protein